MLCQDGLRVKLDPFHRQGLVPHPHDLAIPSPGRDFESLWKGVAFNGQGMVPGGPERAGQPAKHTLSRVKHFRHLAMHQGLGQDHFPSKGFPDGLVAQTNPQNRITSRKLPDQRD